MTSSSQDRYYTYVDKIVLVSDEEVSQDAGLVEVAEADHVLDPLDGGGVHGLDPALGGEPLLLPVIVHHLDPPALGGRHPGPDGDIELPPRVWLDPYVVPLQEQKRV